MTHKCKNIGQSLYEYRGYTIDGYEAHTGLDWRVLIDGEWVETFNTKRECKEAIDKMVDTKTDKARFVSPESHATAAQFHMGFAVEMLNCGRTDEAETALRNAHAQMQMIIDHEEIKNEVFG